MAEFIMKELVRRSGLDERFLIESAAVSTEEIGNGIYPPAKRCLTLHGIPFDAGKTARQVTPGDYRAFDLLIYMDHSNRRWLDLIMKGNGANPDPENKFRLMMSYCNSKFDVADPWYTGDFEATYRDLEEACAALLRELK